MTMMEDPVGNSVGNSVESSDVQVAPSAAPAVTAVPESPDSPDPHAPTHPGVRDAGWRVPRVSRRTPAETDLCEKVLAALAEASEASAGGRSLIGLVEIAHALGVPLGWVEDAFLALEGDGLVETTGVPGPLSGISAAVSDLGRQVVASMPGMEAGH